MRHPRNLRAETEDSSEPELIQRVTEGATLWLMKNLPEDQRAIIREYAEKYGDDWWRKLDLDHGGILTSIFSRGDYADNFLGQSELKPKFKEMIIRAVTT